MFQFVISFIEMYHAMSVIRRTHHTDSMIVLLTAVCLFVVPIPSAGN